MAGWAAAISSAVRSACEASQSIVFVITMPSQVPGSSVRSE